MRLMGLMPIYRRPRDQHSRQGAQAVPVSGCGASASTGPTRCGADITYIPLAKGFLYLVAIMDWWSRKVLAWRGVRTAMDVQFCVDATG